MFVASVCAMLGAVCVLAAVGSVRAVHYSFTTILKKGLTGALPMSSAQFEIPSGQCSGLLSYPEDLSCENPYGKDKLPPSALEVKVEESNNSEAPDVEISKEYTQVLVYRKGKRCEEVALVTITPYCPILLSDASRRAAAEGRPRHNLRPAPARR